MSEPKVIDTVAGWNITRWDYDGAHTEAYKPPKKLEISGRMTPHLDLLNDGEDIELTWQEQSDDCFGSVTRHVSVPIAVLRRVLRDEP